MNSGLPPTSPFFYDSGADYLGRHITITIPFNNSTRVIQNGTVIHRDTGCVYTRITIGFPDQTAARTQSVPNGDTSATANQFRNATGFTNIDDVFALQVTAEP